MTLNIVFIGDSITEANQDPDGGFVGDARRQFPTHNIVNMGVSGNTIAQITDRLKDAALHQPDLLIIAGGVNDARDNARKPDEAFRQDVHGMLSEALETCPHVLVMTPFPVDNNKQVKPVRWPSDLVESRAAMIAEIATEYGVEVLDQHHNVPALLLQLKEAGDLAPELEWPDLTYDGLHLWPQGYRTVSPSICEKIGEMTCGILHEMDRQSAFQQQQSPGLQYN